MPPRRKRIIKRRPVTTDTPYSLATVTTCSNTNSKSVKPNNQLIRRYHTLNKELAQCELNKDVRRIEEIRRELETMGGLDAYQQASVKGASFIRGGDTSRWLVKQLLALNKRPLDGKLRLLDVGALTAHNYRKESTWIEVDAVDLNPREKAIQQVVNFVGDIRSRGRMLQRVPDFLRSNGNTTDETTTTASKKTRLSNNVKFTKQEIHPGGKRNNFCIVID
ncbi:putative methyltransferase-domain-containing protein [Syncephalis plumigaleata]|nr:putative methyltransferase-domain-containing protein [Syncephalis plumigaleata]